MQNIRKVKTIKGARSPSVSKNDLRGRSEPKGAINQLMSPSPVVVLGNEADDIVFNNTVLCAALRKAEPGGLDRLNPSTVRKQQEAEVGRSKKRRTATQLQPVTFGALPTSKAAVNPGKLARTYRAACPPCNIGSVMDEVEAPNQSASPQPMHPDNLIAKPASLEHEGNKGDSDGNKRKKVRPSNHDDDSDPTGHQKDEAEGDGVDDNGDAGPDGFNAEDGNGDEGESSSFNADNGNGDEGDPSSSSSDSESSDDNNDDDDGNDRREEGEVRPSRPPSASAKKRKNKSSQSQKTVVIARASDQKHPTFTTIRDGKPIPNEVDALFCKELKRRKEEMGRFISQGIPATFNALFNVDTTRYIRFVFDTKKMNDKAGWFPSVKDFAAYMQLDFGDVDGLAWEILEDLFPVSLAATPHDTNLNSTLVLTLQRVIKDFVTKLNDRDLQAKQLNVVINETLATNSNLGIRDISQLTVKHSAPLCKLFITELETLTRKGTTDGIRKYALF